MKFYYFSSVPNMHVAFSTKRPVMLNKKKPELNIFGIFRQPGCLFETL
jgi:hypothetical protein